MGLFSKKQEDDIKRATPDLVKVASEFERILDSLYNNKNRWTLAEMDELNNLLNHHIIEQHADLAIRNVIARITFLPVPVPMGQQEEPVPEGPIKESKNNHYQ